MAVKSPLYQVHQLQSGEFFGIDVSDNPRDLLPLKAICPAAAFKEISDLGYEVDKTKWVDSECISRTVYWA